MLESLYENDPSMILNETFNSINTVRWTIVGTPTFSNGTMTTSSSSNYINSILDLSNKNKITIRIKWTVTASKSMTLSQWVSWTYLFIWYYDDWSVYFQTDTAVSWRFVCPSWLNDLIFVYDGTQSTNATKLKIYRNWIAQTLTFSGTMPTALPNYSTRVLSIGWWWRTNNCTFEQVQIRSRSMWADEITVRTNNSLYKNRNPVMNLRNWTVVSWSASEKYETTWVVAMPIWKKYINCVSGYTIAVRSRQAYWTRERSMYSTNTSLTNSFIIINGVPQWWATDRYSLFTSWNTLQFWSTVSWATTVKFTTAVWYISNNTRYRFKVTRDWAWVFTTYIKWWSFWSSYVLVTASTGTNPFTENTTKTSKFFSNIYSSAWSLIWDVRFTPYVI